MHFFRAAPVVELDDDVEEMMMAMMEWVNWLMNCLFACLAWQNEKAIKLFNKDWMRKLS